MRAIQRIQVSEAGFAYLSENNGGFCIECHVEVLGVEPDARHYRCDACESRAVFGAEELLIRGLVEFTDDSCSFKACESLRTQGEPAHANSSF